MTRRADVGYTGSDARPTGSDGLGRTGQRTTGRHRVRRPVAVPQQTFVEARDVGIALADGRGLRNWTRLDGDLALRHQVTGSRLETKLVGASLVNLLDLPPTMQALEDTVQSLGLRAVLLLHVCLALALEQQEVTVALDDLLLMIGWTPHSRSERDTQRAALWQWLCVLDSLLVIGRRPGRYTDRITRQVLDLTSEDALIRITGRRLPRCASDEPNRVPIELTFVAGPWLNRWRGNEQVLSYLGDVMKLAALPAGQPTGAWGQAIGLALQQRWRELASRADIKRVGEQKYATVRTQPFTRRELLSLFRPEPSLDQLLSSRNPRRACEYWSGAIKMLAEQGIIRSCREKASLDIRRQGWAQAWITQPLDIRPGTDGTHAIVAIEARAQAARNARRSPAIRRPSDVR